MIRHPFVLVVMAIASTLLVLADGEAARLWSPEDRGRECELIPPGTEPWSKTNTGGPFTRQTFLEGMDGNPEAIERFAAYLDLRPGMTVADVGGGNGWLVKGLVRFVAPGGGGILEDINPLAVEMATINLRAHPNIEVVHGDPWNVRLAPESLDRAVLHQTHFFVHSPEDPWTLSCLRSLFLAVRPGGRVLVVDHAAFGRQTALETATPFWRVGFDILETKEDWTDAGPTHSHLILLERPGTRHDGIRLLPRPPHG